MEISKRNFMESLLFAGSLLSTGCFEEEKEKIMEIPLGYLADKNLKKPNLESLVKIPFFKVLTSKMTPEGYTLPYPSPHELPEMQLYNYSKGQDIPQKMKLIKTSSPKLGGYRPVRKVTPIITSRKYHNKIEVTYSTKDCFENAQHSMRTGKRKRLNKTPDLRLNNSESKVFLLHPDETKNSKS